MTEMNEDTDYVHEAVVNCEPTYLGLDDICGRWMDDQDNGIAEYRDELQEMVEHAVTSGVLYMDASDLTDEVDYAAMIQWEVEHA